jgi:hypothetical protein
LSCAVLQSRSHANTARPRQCTESIYRYCYITAGVTGGKMFKKPYRKKRGKKNRLRVLDFTETSRYRCRMRTVCADAVNAVFYQTVPAAAAVSGDLPRATAIIRSRSPSRLSLAIPAERQHRPLRSPPSGGQTTRRIEGSRDGFGYGRRRIRGPAVGHVLPGRSATAHAQRRQTRTATVRAGKSDAAADVCLT